MARCLLGRRWCRHDPCPLVALARVRPDTRTTTWRRPLAKMEVAFASRPPTPAHGSLVSLRALVFLGEPEPLRGQPLFSLASPPPSSHPPTARLSHHTGGPVLARPQRGHRFGTVSWVRTLHDDTPSCSSSISSSRPASTILPPSRPSLQQQAVPTVTVTTARARRSFAKLVSRAIIQDSCQTRRRRSVDAFQVFDFGAAGVPEALHRPTSVLSENFEGKEARYHRSPQVLPCGALEQDHRAQTRQLPVAHRRETCSCSD